MNEAFRKAPLRMEIMGKKILVVDNDRLMVEFMVDLFQEEGHQVIAARDGLSALETLKTFVPDVAFIDLVMPNIRGDRLCRIMRGMPLLKNLFIAIISATTLEELTHHAELGANAAIAKGPFVEMSKQLLAILEQSDESDTNGSKEAFTGRKDIYQRKITRELLYAERHLETILNNISEGVFELNRHGKIIFCNNKGFSLSGFSEAALLGQDFFDLFTGKDREKIETLLLKIGDGPPEVADSFPVTLFDNRVSLKLLPMEDHMGWSVVAIVSPLPHAADVL